MHGRETMREGVAHHNGKEKRDLYRSHGARRVTEQENEKQHRVGGAAVLGGGLRITTKMGPAGPAKRDPRYIPAPTSVALKSCPDTNQRSRKRYTLAGTALVLLSHSEPVPSQPGFAARGSRTQSVCPLEPKLLFAGVVNIAQTELVSSAMINPHPHPWEKAAAK